MRYWLSVIVVLAGCSDTSGRDDRDAAPADALPDAATVTCDPLPSASCASAPAGTACGPGECDGSGHCILVLASNQTAPGSLAVGDGQVYWIGGGPTNAGYLRRCSACCCGDAPTTLASNQAFPLSDLRLDRGRFFWIDAGTTGLPADASIVSCESGSCSDLAPILTGTSGAGITLDASNVYFTIAGNGNGSIASCARTGCGDSAMPLAMTDHVPGELLMVGTLLVWAETNSGPGLGAVMACEAFSCTPTPLVLNTAQPNGLATDGTNIYFTAGLMGNGSVQKCALSGCGNQATTLASGLDIPGAIATDGTNVYFTTTPMGAAGAVYKCPVAGCGGAATVIAQGPKVFSPGALALDADSVYFTDYNTLVVAKTAK